MNTTYVQSSRDDTQARCSCGWLGPTYTYTYTYSQDAAQSDARADANAHRDHA